MRNELRWKALKPLRKSHEKIISVPVAEKVRPSPSSQKFLGHMLWWILSEADPIEAVFERFDTREEVEDRVILATVADDDPNAPFVGIFKYRLDVTAMLVDLLPGVEKDKTITLAVEMKYRFVPNLVRIKEV